MFKLVRVKAVTPYKVTGTVHDVLCVGRAPQSDLCVMDRLISANHARVALKGHALHVTDLDSRNGTEVNGQRLKPFTPHTLRPNDVIDFAGRLALRVVLSPSEGLPVLQVEPDDASPPRPPPPSDPARASGGGILRTLRLPPDAASQTPDLKPDRWAALYALSVHLSRRALQADADAWLRSLCDLGAAALGASQVQLLRLLDGKPARVAPEHGACRVRAEAIDDLLQGGLRDGPLGVASVELLSGDLDALDLQETFDAPQSGGVAPPQIITLHLGPLWLHGQPWGLLYATHELSGRRRPLDPQDLWAFERLCALTSASLEGVIASLSPQPPPQQPPRAARLLLP